MNKKKRELLCEFQDRTCEICHQEKALNELEVHRINEGYQGGTYKNHRNLKVVCIKCHKLLHGGEFGHVSHSY